MVRKKSGKGKSIMKMAIISSYSESCGNAAFTKVLHDSIEQYSVGCDVDVIELNLSLLQSKHFKIRRLADDHVVEICKKMQEYDYINIQFEAGLFGSIQKDIVARMRKIIDSHRNVSITLHSPRLMSGGTGLKKTTVFKKMAKGHFIQGYRELKGRGMEEHIKTNFAIIEHAVKKNIPLIVHTNRAKRQIFNFFSYNNVRVHPLVIVPEDYVGSDNYISTVRTAFQFSERDVVIGMFGYISAYKGHTDAILALEHLPKNYKLLIFGRQHPQTIKQNVKDDYLQDLAGQVKNLTERESRVWKTRTINQEGKRVDETKKEVNTRIYFVGELSDDELLDVAGSVDVCWLPYYENGQDGSGIASICLDVGRRVLCSHSFAFDELFKLKKYHNVMRFDIGNDLEIAAKTVLIMEKPAPIKPYGDNSKYNIRTQVQTYIDV